ncbi:Metallo-dependent phosphatase [Ophiobolus disseminans]|uniref:Metallo-dependent phosphatase n=1 Tax=Ophiobolus disseminans TaxID=1469910 RepID=A0A6A7A6C9_9PLEO|nr:Metallo-dependent phosphatase [Ophiobolus disseminans]
MLAASLNPFYRQSDPFEPTPFLALLFQAPVKLLLYHAYNLITSLRSTPKPTQPLIRIVCISDTHTHIPQDVPAGDILIHAGDMTNAGSVAEIQTQIDWLASLPHKEIVVISGNHDTYLDPRTRPSLSEDERKGNVEWGRVHYLQHRRLSLTIEASSQDSSDGGERRPLLADNRSQRRIRIYGAPQIPACGPMSVHAFQYPRGQDAWSETVPEDTDILVTHTPPKWHLDLPLPDGMGCEHLLAEVRRVKPTVHVFGHVHWGAGKTVVWWDKGHDAFCQGMAVRSKWTHGVLNPRLWWSVVRVLYRGILELLWDRVWGGQSFNTIIVNAAQMHGNTGKLSNTVQVVDI